MKIDATRFRTVQIHTRPYAMAGFMGFRSQLQERLRWLFDDDDALAAALTDIERAISQSKLAQRIREQGPGLALRKQIADLQNLYGTLLEANERLFLPHIPASALPQMNAHYTARHFKAPCEAEVDVTGEIKCLSVRLSILAECVKAVDLTPTGVTNPGKRERDDLIRVLLGIFERYLGAAYTGGAASDGESVGETVEEDEARRDKQREQHRFIEKIFQVYRLKLPRHLPKLIARLEKIPP
jgi:hypothetical protein